MSLITSPQENKHYLLYNYLKELRIQITNLRVNNYTQKLKRIFRAEGKSLQRTLNVDWFEELPQGCLFYVEGHKEPMRGIVSMELINAGFIWKRAIVYFLRFLNGEKGKEGFKKKNIFEKAFIIISLLKHYDFYKQFIWHNLWDYFYDDLSKFCPPILEIYKAFPAGMEKERDIICFFLETDHAYRYRMQDIVSELDKEALKRNPIKELKRLMDIIIDRDEEGTMKNKWRQMKKLIIPAYYYLKFFKRDLYKKLMKMADDLNIEAIKPTKEDIYWTNERGNYKFRGLSLSARKLINK